MLKYFCYPALVFVFILSSCTSGKKALERGDYYQSSLQAIERLRKNPDHKKSRMVLEKSYPLAVKFYTDKINNLRHSSDPFKNGQIVANYQILNQLYDEIQRCPAALEIIPNPGKYYNEIQTYSGLAAEERYNAGMAEMKSGSRMDAKDAYYNFLKANDYSPGYKDVAEWINRAHEAATLYVIFDQIPVPTVQYQLSVQFFQDQVEQFLSNYKNNEFIRFIPARDNTDSITPDQYMVINFDDFSVGNTNNYKDTREVSRDSVVVGKVKMDDGTQKDVIGTVKATYTEFREEIISKGLVSMRIMNANNNQVLLHQKYPGEYDWRTYWATYKGDERALSREELSRTKSRAVEPPDPQDLFIEFCKPIYNQLTTSINSFYSQY